MEWISIKDKMPPITRISEENEPVLYYEVSNDVLCLLHDKNMIVARYNKINGNRRDYWDTSGYQAFSININGRITHWMPLPKLPIQD